jgi:hypothetical protein
MQNMSKSERETPVIAKWKIAHDEKESHELLKS